MPAYRQIEDEYALFSKYVDDPLIVMEALLRLHKGESTTIRLTGEEEANVQLYFDHFGTLVGLTEWVLAFRSM